MCYAFKGTQDERFEASLLETGKQSQQGSYRGSAGGDAVGCLPLLNGWALILAAAAQHAQRDEGADGADQSNEEKNCADSSSQGHSLEHRCADILALFLPVGDRETLKIRLEVINVLSCDALMIIKVEVFFVVVVAMVVWGSMMVILLVAFVDLLELVCDVCGVHGLEDLDAEILDAVGATCTVTNALNTE